MALFSRHPQLHQTAYAELKRRALEQRITLTGTPGSVGVRTVNRSPFIYRQFYDALGKKRAEYIGPVGDEASEARARSRREAVDLATALIKEARTLRREGYVRVDSRSGAVLGALANRGGFRGGAVLVGSHAYGVLLNELGVRGAAFMTEDVDVACGGSLEVALGPGESLETILAESFVPLLPVPGLDRKAPSTSYKARGPDRFRFDLLAPARGSSVSVVPVRELRAHATALPYLAYLLSSPLDAVVLAREGVVAVKVPRPEAFVWHKMLVSQLRGETREKRTKDLAQAAAVFAVLAEDEPDALAEALHALPRGARSATRTAGRRLAALLESGGHTMAAALLASLMR